MQSKLSFFVYVFLFALYKRTWKCFCFSATLLENQHFQPHQNEAFSSFLSFLFFAHTFRATSLSFFMFLQKNHLNDFVPSEVRVILVLYSSGHIGIFKGVILKWILRCINVTKYFKETDFVSDSPQ